VAGAVAVFISAPAPKKNDVDIDVIESPKLAPVAVPITQAKVSPKVTTKHQVFGVSRKSVSAAQGETVKTGNTLAKTPDLEKLKPEDEDSLPIPSEEYLITKMPELKTEVRIPYPASAKKKGVQGAVIMDLLIDATGRVREVLLVGGPDPDLNGAAVVATKNFQFTSAMIQDKPVAVRIRYAYRFVLEH